MKDEFKQPKIDTTRYAVEVKGDIVPVMGVDYDGIGKPKEIIGAKATSGGSNEGSYSGPVLMPLNAISREALELDDNVEYMLDYAKIADKLEALGIVLV